MALAFVRSLCLSRLHEHDDPDAVDDENEISPGVLTPSEELQQEASAGALEAGGEEHGVDRGQQLEQDGLFWDLELVTLSRRRHVRVCVCAMFA